MTYSASHQATTTAKSQDTMQPPMTQMGVSKMTISESARPKPAAIQQTETCRDPEEDDDNRGQHGGLGFPVRLPELFTAFHNDKYHNNIYLPVY